MAKGFCSKCGEPLSKENATPTTLKRMTGFCNPCYNAGKRKYRYGVTKESFEKQLELQKGLCAICGSAMARPEQDHNHVTGEARELLCHSCNWLLGCCFENKDILLAAVRYLEKHLP